jgi:hypothetical protein
MHIFQQIIGIPMGINCASFLSVLLNEAELKQNNIKDKRNTEAKAFTFILFRIMWLINHQKFA